MCIICDDPAIKAYILLQVDRFTWSSHGWSRAHTIPFEAKRRCGKHANISTYGHA